MQNPPLWVLLISRNTPGAQPDYNMPILYVNVRRQRKYLLPVDNLDKLLDDMQIFNARLKAYK